MKLRPSHPAGQALGPLADRIGAVIATAGAGRRHRRHRRDAAQPGRRSRVTCSPRCPARRRTAADYAADAVGARCGRRAHRRGRPGAHGRRRATVPVLVRTRPAVGARRRWPPPSTATRRGTLRVIGVTGTSGKTTTTYLVEAGLRAADRVAGLIGTVGIRIDGRGPAERADHTRGARPAGAAGA